ncbi:hypothetical protein SUDANB58_02118 [Streptomyces sp. enrichment culture]|uniref:(2Fe-2S)-binding protein n=1 Tax=Streptomyces sp. enrichment culture TaxID=1795815 RepID=UPI003F56D0A1
MTDDQHGEGMSQGGGRWDPLPQGDYDDGATAFVQLPEGGVDAFLAATDSPLAAPGHGYVPPQITVTQAATAGADPAAAGPWATPPAPDGAAQWHAPGVPDAGYGQQGPDAGYGQQGPDAGYGQQGSDAGYGQQDLDAGYGHGSDGVYPQDPEGGYGQQAPDAGYGHGSDGVYPQDPEGGYGQQAPDAGYGQQGSDAGYGQQDLDAGYGHGSDGVYPQDPDAGYRQHDPYGVAGRHGEHGDPDAVHPYAANDRFTYHPDTAGRWDSAEAAAAEYPSGPVAVPAPGHDVTGQWSIPVAGGDLPDESGEFTTSSLVEQWGGTPPATLPGGAPAPWATPVADRSTDHGERHPDAHAVPEHDTAPYARHPAEAAEAAEPPQAVEPEAAVAPEAEPPSQSSPEPAEEPPPAAAEEPSPAGAEPEGTGEPDSPAQAPAATPDTPDIPDDPGTPQALPLPDAPVEALAAPAPAEDAVPAPAPAEDVTSEPEAAGEPGAAQAPTRSAEDEADGTEPADAADEADGTEPADAADAADGTEPADAAEETDAAAPAEAASGEQPPAGAPPAPEEEPAAAPVAHDEHPLASYVLRVNGTDRPVTGAWIGESLLYVLRERLGLAGAKDGCSQGECGACNVQVDGRLVASCLVPAATAAGSEVRTVEGLAADGQPSDVQRALARCGAVQCGFCVPGMAMTVHDLLEGNPAPTELEARQALCGNLCRCSGYRGVLRAVEEVVAERRAHAAADTPGADAGQPHAPHQAGPSVFDPPAAPATPGPPDAPGPHDQPYGQDGGHA